MGTSHSKLDSKAQEGSDTGYDILSPSSSASTSTSICSEAASIPRNSDNDSNDDDSDVDGAARAGQQPASNNEVCGYRDDVGAAEGAAEVELPGLLAICPQTFSFEHGLQSSPEAGDLNLSDPVSLGYSCSAAGDRSTQVSEDISAELDDMAFYFTDGPSGSSDLCKSRSSCSLRLSAGDSQNSISRFLASDSDPFFRLPTLDEEGCTNEAPISPLLVPGLSSLPTQCSDESGLNVDSTGSSYSQSDGWDLADETRPQLLFQHELSRMSPAKEDDGLHMKTRDTDEDIFSGQDTLHSSKEGDWSPSSPLPPDFDPLSFFSPGNDYPMTSSFADIPRLFPKDLGSDGSADSFFSPPTTSKWVDLSDSTLVEPQSAKAEHGGYTCVAQAMSPSDSSPIFAPDAPFLGTVPLPPELVCSPKRSGGSPRRKMPLYIHNNIVSVCLPSVLQTAELCGLGNDEVRASELDVDFSTDNSSKEVGRRVSETVLSSANAFNPTADSRFIQNRQEAETSMPAQAVPLLYSAGSSSIKVSISGATQGDQKIFTASRKPKASSQDENQGSKNARTKLQSNSCSPKSRPILKKQRPPRPVFTPLENGQAYDFSDPEIQGNAAASRSPVIPEELSRRMSKIGIHESALENRAAFSSDPPVHREANSDLSEAPPVNGSQAP